MLALSRFHLYLYLLYLYMYTYIYTRSKSSFERYILNLHKEKFAQALVITYPFNQFSLGVVESQCTEQVR